MPAKARDVKHVLVAVAPTHPVLDLRPQRALQDELRGRLQVGADLRLNSWCPRYFGCFFPPEISGLGNAP